LIERIPSLQQVLKSSVSALFAEKLSDVVKVIDEEFTSEIQRERFTEIELSLVWYLQEFVAVANVVWQFVQIVDELGVVINLARLLAQKRFMFASAANGHEFECLLYVSKADAQRSSRVGRVHYNVVWDRGRASLLPSFIYI
jgi:hypothetical protein